MYVDQFIANNHSLNYFKGTVSLHKYTDYFEKEYFSKNTGSDCTEFDQYGDPIPCNINPIDGTSTDAVSFNTYMVAKFGEVEVSAKLEGADANDPVKLAAFLNGKNGIYVIINNDGRSKSSGGAGYSGHCDVIINGMCISGANTNPQGGVKSIRIWELN